MDYIYCKSFCRIFTEFANEINPKTGKRKRSEASINQTYKHRFNDFLEFLSRPKYSKLEIEEITQNHISEFFDTLDRSDINNYYRTLLPFFKFCYKHNYTKDLTKDLNANIKESKKTDIISDKDCASIKAFINGTGPFEERLLLALLYYSGLNLKTIFELDHNAFDKSPNGDVYSILWVKTVHVPIKKELQEILKQHRSYLEVKGVVNPKTKILNYERSADISGKVARLTNKICDGNSYTPKNFQITFINKALKVNMNPFFVSQLVLTKTESVAKYITQDLSFSEQSKILSQIEL